VDVLVEFADGTAVRQPWDGESRWTTLSFERPSPATRAFVDPDRVLLLDRNVTNNSLTLTPRAGEAATRWMLPWIVWLQDRLLMYGFLI
jgi:hypothetical protein